MGSDFSRAYMLMLITSLALVDIDLGDEHHIDEGPNEPKDAAADNDQKFGIECQRTTARTTGCGLEMAFKIVCSDYHLGVESLNYKLTKSNKCK